MYPSKLLDAHFLRSLFVLVASTLLVQFASARAPRLPLQTPASFKGELPCRDCDGVRAQLDLWPDGVFHLQRAFVGKPDRDDDRGRWRMDPERPVILLYGGREMPLQLEVTGTRTLRPLDLDGRRLSGGKYQLISPGALAPADLTLGLHGMFRNMADAARFEECLTGRSYPVAMESDFIALQSAYQAARMEPGAPLMASFEGSIVQRPAMEGPSPVLTVVVHRFIGVWPNQTCERAMSRSSLTDQYWRMVTLRGQPVIPVGDQREAHIVLHGRDGHYAGNVACTRFNGRYWLDGASLRLFTPDPGIPAVCSASPSAAGADAAKIWFGVVEAARRWSIGAQAMEWFDEQGRSIALFEAVHLR